jgi:hypothetical protein
VFRYPFRRPPGLVVLVVQYVNAGRHSSLSPTVGARGTCLDVPGAILFGLAVDVECELGKTTIPTAVDHSSVIGSAVRVHYACIELAVWGIVPTESRNPGTDADSAI